MNSKSEVRRQKKRLRQKENRGLRVEARSETLKISRKDYGLGRYAPYFILAVIILFVVLINLFK